MERTLATAPWYKKNFVWIVTSSEVNHNNKINKKPGIEKIDYTFKRCCLWRAPEFHR